jgi:hypothetical protein
MRRPAARPEAKRLHNDVVRRSSAAFPSVSRGRFLAAKIGANSLAKTIFQKAAGAWITDRRTTEVSKKELRELLTPRSAA